MQNKRHMQQIPGIEKSGPAMPTHPGRLAGATAEADADVGRYYVFVDQVLQRGVMDGVDEFLTDDFIEHGIGGDHVRDEFLSRIRHQRAQFPDLVWTIELLVAVNGLVLCHATMTEAKNPPATTCTWESVVVRFDAGKMVECWRMRNESLLTNPHPNPNPHAARA
jgi:predicted SnoaL-like aldol condensation-catalyzing enzyme